MKLIKIYNESSLLLKMIRIYLIGILILVCAIAANLVAAKWHLKTWYDLLQGLSNSNMYIKQLTFFDYLWLFLLYPLILGGGAVLGNFIYQKLAP